MIVKMIGVINSSIRIKDSIWKRIRRPIRFEIRFERKNDSQVPYFLVFFWHFVTCPGERSPCPVLF